MPAPLGSKDRPHRFLLRLTDDENQYVRDRARAWEVPLNTAISMIIRDARERDRYDELMAAKRKAEAETPPPAKKPAPAKKTPPAPKKERGAPRKGTPSFTFSDLAKPDTDQESP